MANDEDSKTMIEQAPSGLPAYNSNPRKLEEELSKDDTLLASLGYKAELKRDFTALEVFGLAFSIIGLLPSISSTLVYSMPAGGLVGMVCSLLTFLFSTEIGIGMGLAHCSVFDFASWFG